ncbi:ocr-like anti-restriction [Bacillus phage vB_BanS_Nate]|uniref:DNA polymerase type-B epsilon subfamily n=1 Tax=Bacillus phage vB_BanS_Nate TaxID=2894788 RepID=A0AAE8YU94_9CAUD|nr:ocr-like anti-restriction [Bacillus phage vB_BanS_Nate]UGO50870.1 DNA polymerase type-B epsilon subfamily [Bacillus phage vB_BanS_Nate]
MIELKDYEHDEVIGNEEDAMDAFMERTGTECVCDGISQIADDYIPIYDYNVWEHVSDIKEQIEEAISSGIANVESGEIDLIKIFQAGYYQYYSEILSHNLDELCYNYVAKKINDYLDTVDTSGIDIAEIDSRIESETDDYDHNNSFDTLEEFSNEIIEGLKQGEYSF